VYDCTIQEKAERRKETSRTRRGTKRRGSRSHVKRVRKRRRVIAADPVSKQARPHQMAFSRRAYLDDRRVRFVKKLLGFITAAKLQKDCEGSYRAIRDRFITVTTRRVVDVMSSHSGDSKEFCRNSVKVYVQVTLMGWESLGVPEDFVPLAGQSEFKVPSAFIKGKVSRVSTVVRTDEDGTIHPSQVLHLRPDRKPRRKTGAVVAKAQAVPTASTSVPIRAKANDTTRKDSSFRCAHSKPRCAKCVAYEAKKSGRRGRR